MTRVGLVTSRELPDLDEGDRPLLGAFRDAGARAEPLVWDDPAVDWGAFDALLLRSCWDYPARFAAFSAWLDRLERLGVAVFNPLATVRWNLDKRYLLELEARGVPIVPTRVLDPPDAESLTELATAEAWLEVVIKPSVGANAVGLLRVRAGDGEGVDRIARALGGLRDTAPHPEAATLVQPFVPEIARGEWSLVFLGGAYSHAAVKRPARGEFRTQPHLGGTWTPAAPARDVRAHAEDVLARVDRPWVYARVDAVPTARGVLLMELELTEPSLLFEARADAAERLVALLLDRI